MNKTDKLTKYLTINGKKQRICASLEIKLEDGCFSAMGSLDTRGLRCFGQCLDHIKSFFDKNGLVCEKLNGIIPYWNRWHLNYLTPGSPRQMDIISKRKKLDQACDYNTMCNVLKTLGIYEDKEFIYNGKPYVYGTAWLKTEIPEGVQKRIMKVAEMPFEIKVA